MPKITRAGGASIGEPPPEPTDQPTEPTDQQSTDQGVDKGFDYDQMTVLDLRAELRKRGYAASGSKKDLIERLQILDADHATDGV
jgi:hypothetical protein